MHIRNQSWNVQSNIALANNLVKWKQLHVADFMKFKKMGNLVPFSLFLWLICWWCTCKYISIYICSCICLNIHLFIYLNMYLLCKFYIILSFCDTFVGGWIVRTEPVVQLSSTSPAVMIVTDCHTHWKKCHSVTHKLEIQNSTFPPAVMIVTVQSHTLEF